MTPRLSTFALAASLACAACSTQQGVQATQSSATAATQRAQLFADQARSRLNPSDAERERAQEVDAPWLAAKSVPLAREASLPAVLKQRLKLGEATPDALGRLKFTAITPECNPNTYTLVKLASCITAVTGLAVKVNEDALLARSGFGPRRSGAASAGPVAGATLSGGSASGQTEVLSVPLVNLELAALLDLADATFGVNHRINEAGAIEIYRLETRVLRLKALAQKVTNSVTTSAGFASESKTTYESTATDLIANIKASLLALGTVAGTVDINPDSKAVVVTDTPAAIARMEAFIESENKRLSRRVTLVFEELFVTASHTQDVSIDWSLLYSKLGGAQGLDMTLKSPASLANTNVGSVGIAVPTTGKLSGTTLVINALAQMGLQATVRSFPISTLNGNAQVFGLPTIFDYVAQVTNNAVSSTSGTVSAPTVTQKDDKYGVYLTVTPDAQDDGQILISLNMADRSGTLTPYTVQVAGAGTTVQQRNIQETNVSARTVLRAGVTQLIGGLNESVNTSTTRRLDDKAPLMLGGSDDVTQTKRNLILLVTAVAEDNI